jgi:hypothetical protein
MLLNIREGMCVGVVILGGRGFPCLCGAWSLLSRGILLSKALLTGFRFPVVITNSSSVHDHPAPKLPEH